MFISSLALLILASVFATVNCQEEPPISPGDQSLWPRAEVFYEIDPSLDPEARRNLQAAVEDYHKKTCIRWLPRLNETAYVLFKYPGQEGCAWSDNCYGPDRVRVTNFAYCRDTGTMIHEMGHTLCFGHEQARIDRDEYFSESCNPGGKYTHLNGGHFYDFLSVMHYPFDKSCSKLEGVEKIGSNGVLSVLDAEKLNGLYGCGGCLSYRFKNASKVTEEDHPMIGGNEGQVQYYPCRAYVNGDIIPGKTTLNGNLECLIASTGSERTVEGRYFEVLTNPTGIEDIYRWEKGGGREMVPANAIAGGRTTLGDTLYIARCVVGEDRYLGKMAAAEPTKMFYSRDGVEQECADFEVLVCSKFVNSA